MRRGIAPRFSQSSVLRSMAWLALALVGAAGYLWLRNRAVGIARDGALFLAPGLLVTLVAVGAAALALYLPRGEGRRAQWVELGLLLAGGLAFRAVLVGLAPTFSHDAYRYVWDAHLVAHGISPWAHTVTDPVLTPLRDAVIWPQVNWRDAPTIYPPGAELLFWTVHAIAPLNIGAMQAAMGFFDALCCALTLLLLRAQGLDLRRVALYWWNPIPVLEFFFNAHVDVVAAALLLFAVLTTLRAPHRASPRDRHPLWRALGGVALGFAALIKIYPLLYAVALVRRRDWPCLGGMLATLVLVPLPFLYLGIGSGGFLGTYFAQRFLDEGLAFRVLTTLLPAGHVQTLAQFALLAAACGVVALLRLAHRLSTVPALLALTAAWLLLTPHLFPWYVGGLLPLLALEVGLGSASRRACGLALALFALAAPFTYVVFAPGGEPNLFLLFYVVPLALALAPLGLRLAESIRHVSLRRMRLARIHPLVEKE